MPRRSWHAPICLFVLASASASLWDDWDDWAPGWTERLGLSFTDDCQEHTGVAALWAWAESWLGGRGGRQRNAHCETKEMSCPPGVAVTGLQVRSGHVRKGGNRELYDFKLRCGEAWLPNWLGLRFDIKEELNEAAGMCRTGGDISGVQVMRGRGESTTGARDYYMFKLRCGREWREVVGLPFDRLRETRSATCPSGRSVSGVRVHRGFQDWGSVDTYEFQLNCLPLDETDDADADEGRQGSFGLLPASWLTSRAAGGGGPASSADGARRGTLGREKHAKRGLRQSSARAAPDPPTDAASEGYGSLADRLFAGADEAWQYVAGALLPGEDAHGLPEEQGQRRASRWDHGEL